MNARRIILAMLAIASLTIGIYAQGGGAAQGGAAAVRTGRRPPGGGGGEKPAVMTPGYLTDWRVG